MTTNIINQFYIIKINKKAKEIEITLKGNAAIAEVNEKIDLENLNEVSNLEKELNKELKKTVEDSIQNIKNKYNSDIFGFRDLIYKTNPKYYKEINKDWYKGIFQNIKVNVKVEVKGKEKGSLNRGVYQ